MAWFALAQLIGRPVLILSGRTLEEIECLGKIALGRDSFAVAMHRKWNRGEAAWWLSECPTREGVLCVSETFLGGCVRDIWGRWWIGQMIAVDGGVGRRAIAPRYGEIADLLADRPKVIPAARRTEWRWGSPGGLDERNAQSMAIRSGLKAGGWLGDRLPGAFRLSSVDFWRRHVRPHERGRPPADRAMRNYSY